MSSPVPSAAATLSPRDAARRLFGDGGPLALDANPALLLAGDATEIAGNAAAALLRPLFRNPPPDLAAALAASRAGAARRLATLDFEPESGPRTLSLDLSLLPCGDAILVLARDVSLERALRGALIDSRQRLKDLIERAADFTWEVDGAQRFAFVSGQNPLGYAPSELIGRSAGDFALSGEADAAFAGAGPREGSEIWLRDASGRPLCLLVQGEALEAGSGPFRGARGLARDITAQKMREAELAEARHRERLVLHLMRSLRRNIEPEAALAAALETAIQAVGADRGCVHGLAADGGRGDCLTGMAGEDDDLLACAALAAENGLAMERVGGRHGIAFVCRHEQRATGLFLLWRQESRGSWAADDIFLLSELAEQVAVLIEQHKGQEALRQLSTTDALTGLLNRRGFENVLARAVTRARLEGAGAGPGAEGGAGANCLGALMYVDLDNFKQVNDRFGHAEGDAALVAAADLLRENLRARDPIGRLGGDEFVAWLDGVGPDEARAKAAELQQAARALARFAPDAAEPLGLSIGIALMRPAATGGEDDLGRLMARADEAMYRVKQGGKGGFALVA